jgi:hypothetical protein
MEKDKEWKCVANYCIYIKRPMALTIPRKAGPVLLKKVGW